MPGICGTSPGANGRWSRTGRARLQDPHGDRPPDGIRWNEVNRDLIESRIEEDEAQASPDVFYANGKYHMFFCYRYSSRLPGQGERATASATPRSTDLIDWVRDDAKAGIDVSDEGWDAEMVSYPHVFELDGKTYLAYLGNRSAGTASAWPCWTASWTSGRAR